MPDDVSAVQPCEVDDACMDAEGASGVAPRTPKRATKMGQDGLLSPAKTLKTKDAEPSNMDLTRFPGRCIAPRHGRLQQTGARLQNLEETFGAQMRSLDERMRNIESGADVNTAKLHIDKVEGNIKQQMEGLIKRVQEGRKFFFDA